MNVRILNCLTWQVNQHTETSRNGQLLRTVLTRSEGTIDQGGVKGAG